MGAQIKSSTEGRTLILTLSNPGLRNALGPEMYAAGIEALGVAESNPEIRSVILRGEGNLFCAGGNLHRLQDNRAQAPEVQALSIEGLHSWIEALHTFPKPVIAAVEGAAAGAGFSLALACDFIVAASDAVFVMAYSNVGLSPDGGATWSLTRALPPQQVHALLMCGERIPCARLLELGLVNRMTEPGKASDEALALASVLNARAPNVLASVKELVHEAARSPLSSQLTRERDHFLRNLHHPNAGIGIAAFLAKQTPEYP